MGCIFVLISVFSPRLAVVLMWIFTPWVDRAFGPVIWPILGIIFLPLTTLLYVILWNTGGRGVTGWEWIFVVLAVFVDVASHGASARQRPGRCHRDPCYSFSARAKVPVCSITIAAGISRPGAVR